MQWTYETLVMGCVIFVGLPGLKAFYFMLASIARVAVYLFKFISNVELWSMVIGLWWVVVSSIHCYLHTSTI